MPNHEAKPSQVRHAYFTEKLQVRAEAQQSKRYIEGYFAVFDQITHICGEHYEVIAQGAFARALRENDIRSLFNHEHGFVLGRNKNGTLTLREDAHGLWGSVEVNESDAGAMDVYARVARGDISGCSFGFYESEEVPDLRSDGTYLWTQKDIGIIEVSVCTFPAYAGTDVDARVRAYTQSMNERLGRTRQALKKRLEDIKC